MKFLKRGDERVEDEYLLSEEPTNLVMIEYKEYCGLKNALRILHDDALKEIPKHKADEHGYTLVNAMYYNDLESWLITKRTPYSINMPPDVVKLAVLEDLKRYYHYIEENDLFKEYECGFYKVKEIVRRYKDCKVLNENDESILEHLLKPLDLKFTYNFNEVQGNYGAGVYFIKYYSNEVF